MGAIRAFVGIPLAAPARSAVRRACDTFLESAPAWSGEKWVPDHNLHVTVKFIGRIEEPDVALAIESLAGACAGFEPFDMYLDRIVAKPGPGRARMLWARCLDGSGRSAGLAGSIDVALSGLLGLETETRAYSPHVTLVRARNPRPAPRDALDAATAVFDALSPSCGTVPSAPATLVSVSSVTLFRSEPGKTGPVYTELASIPLGND